jgi:acylphosphatase
VAHGRVQGVWFRDGARIRADELGVAGWVRNRSDGAVEAELEGTAEHVELLVRWFERGPTRARVDRLDVDELRPRGEVGFVVLPSAR